MKKFLLICLITLTAAMTASAQKYALLDMEYILKNIPAYERANEQLNQVSKKWQAEVEALNTEASTMYKNYQNEMVFLSQEQKKARQEAKKNAKAQKEAGKDSKKVDLDKDPNHYRVKGPKPIALAGSTYKTGRKAQAEAEAARREAARKAGTTRPKNQSGKAKNKKKFKLF